MADIEVQAEVQKYSKYKLCLIHSLTYALSVLTLQHLKPGLLSSQVFSDPYEQNLIF